MAESLLTQLQYRLEQWAESYSSGNAYGLGFLSSSLEYRLQRDGFLQRGSGYFEPRIAVAAEEIEQWVCELYQQNPQMAVALRQYYFTQGSLRQKAKLGHMSHTQFKHQVDLAHQWLLGRWSAVRSNAVSLSLDIA